VIGGPILFCSGVAIVWTMIRPAHEHVLPVTAFVIIG
jgi:capsular polysaccharide transport system permease protein